ncbi:MAG: SDR family oxidoreductase [Chloroflexota bacterium]|nr:SDR family oxidoreductase [Chloroflexota bacterium]MDE2894476.1 SDR family oxidoreductase [Chloroflexota bacterium]
MGKLDGQVALISGGARGQGEAQARVFAREGAAVALGDVLEDDGQRVAESINDTGGQAMFRRLDVTEVSSWNSMVDETVSQFGRLDIVINNAGIARVKLIEESTLEEYLEVIRINQLGVWLGMKAAIPALKEAGGGCIINTSSTAGLEGYAGLGAYVSSKFAVRGMTKVAAIELAQYNIRVNSVHPGPIDTPMIRDPQIRASSDQDFDIARTSPIPRVGHVDEVAAMMLFIAADATYSTGSEFVIDGGVTAGSALNRDRD